jgi:hypothetical protein
MFRNEINTKKTIDSSLRLSAPLVPLTASQSRHMYVSVSHHQHKEVPDFMTRVDSALEHADKALRCGWVGVGGYKFVPYKS